MFDLVTIGDIKLDTFVLVPEASVQCSLKMPDCQLCLDYGKKIPVELVDSQIAGSAPNVAVGLSRFKFKTAIISMMGKDGTRQMAKDTLKRENVSSRFIITHQKAKSGFAVVLNYHGERTILAAHARCLYRLPSNLPTKWLYLSELGTGYENIFRQIAALRRKKKIGLAFNPGAVQIAEKKQGFLALIGLSDLLFVNREEAQEITGEQSNEIHRLSTALYLRGAKHIIITDGKAGAYDFDGKKLRHCPAFPGKLIEATGAGDAFASGFIGALLHGNSSAEALRWGSVNAASVIGYVGPQKGLLSDREIRKRLKKQKRSVVREL